MVRQAGLRQFTTARPADDMGLEKGGDVDYVMTTGRMNFQRAGRVGNMVPAGCVCYVGDGNSGNVVGYSIKFNRQAMPCEAKARSSARWQWFARDLPVTPPCSEINKVFAARQVLMVRDPAFKTRGVFAAHLPWRGVTSQAPVSTQRIFRLAGIESLSNGVAQPHGRRLKVSHLPQHLTPIGRSARRQSSQDSLTVSMGQPRDVAGHLVDMKQA